MEKEHCKILVVDDEKELRELLQELLRKEGYFSVEVASSCKEAEAKLSENCYQLILLDVMLTDGNGFDFYKQQKKEGLLSEVPVIFLSARDEDKLFRKKRLRNIIIRSQSQAMQTSPILVPCREKNHRNLGK